MSRRCLVIAGALAVTFAGGCSTTSTGPVVDNDDKVYVTGSRIPKSDRSSTGVKATEDPNAIRAIMRPNSAGGGGN